MTRRMRPIALMAVCAAVLRSGLATDVRAQAPGPPLTLRELAPNVWAAVSETSNAGFVIGDDGVLVIDTLATQSAANDLLAEIRTRTTLPIKFVINTHYHLDHVAGNGVFAQAGAVVLAHRNVREWIHAENFRMFGKDITPEWKAAIEASTPPTVVYENGVDLYLASRKVEIRSFPGHTGGDSVVLIGDAKVVFAGDLLWRNTAPNLIDALTKPWVETLDTLIKTGAGSTFVPGHGDVSDVRDVTAFRDYLATLRSLVSDAQRQQRSGDALLEAVMPALTKTYGKWSFFEYLAKANIKDVEAELNGKKRTPPPGR